MAIINKILSDLVDDTQRYSIKVLQGWRSNDLLPISFCATLICCSFDEAEHLTSFLQKAHHALFVEAFCVAVTSPRPEVHALRILAHPASHKPSLHQRTCRGNPGSPWHRSSSSSWIQDRCCCLAFPPSRLPTNLGQVPHSTAMGLHFINYRLARGEVKSLNLASCAVVLLVYCIQGSSALHLSGYRFQLCYLITPSNLCPDCVSLLMYAQA